LVLSIRVCVSALYMQGSVTPYLVLQEQLNSIICIYNEQNSFHYLEV